MSRDGDFGEYVEARWSRLVRSAVLLGCSRAEAEDVVQTALTRCLVHWRRVERADDRDAYVHRILVNTFISSRRRRWTREDATFDLPDVPGVDQILVVDDADAVLRAVSVAWAKTSERPSCCATTPTSPSSRWPPCSASPRGRSRAACLVP